jgi:lipid A 4'-phosphatase
MLCRIAVFLAAFLILCGALVLWPGIDVATSALFYAPGSGFTHADWAPFRLLHASVPALVVLTIVASLALLLVPAQRRIALFMLIALALGPGLVVNTLFKDHWGRARPTQIAAFGGDKRMTPAFVPSDQCTRNCSFPAGDPAVGFYLVAAAFLVAPPKWRRPAAGGAILLAGALALVRIAQGGHFLSDVAASFFFVFATSWVLYRWIVVADGLPALWRNFCRPPPELQRFALVALVIAASILLAVGWIDRPLADHFRANDPTVQTVFRFITGFGLSTPYLVIAAVIVVGFARWRALIAWRAAFVFVAVAGAGLVGDILKPVFGRARPRLWLSDQVFGFTWHGARAAYWSFPSGHAITIVALAGSLAVIERRGLPLYVAAALLVTASRIVLDEHYLSDVLAGALLAAAVTWAARAGFERAGIQLAISDSP